MIYNHESYIFESSNYLNELDLMIIIFLVIIIAQITRLSRLQLKRKSKLTIFLRFTMVDKTEEERMGYQQLISLKVIDNM